MSPSELRTTKLPYCNAKSQDAHRFAVPDNGGIIFDGGKEAHRASMQHLSNNHRPSPSNDNIEHVHARK